MKYPVYQKRQPSGVEWLGDIPEEWDVRRIATMATKITNGFVGPTRDILVNDGVRYLQSLHIKENKIAFHKEYFVEPEWSAAHSKSILKEGDVVVVQTGDIGQVACVPKEFEGCNCHALIIISPRGRELCGRFLAHYLNSTVGFDELKRIETGALHPHLNCGLVRDVRFPFPSLAEQSSIADFLDAETAKLDTLVAKKRELIEKLKEKRSALISRTVTRGLPPEAARAAGLDLNPKLKPSGIEWLGEVPEHWSIPPLYTRYTIELGKMLDESRITGNHLIPYLRNVDVQWEIINTTDLPEMDVRRDEYSRYTLREGDLLVCEGGEVGRAAIFHQSDAVLGFQKALHRLRAIKSTEHPRFLYYTLAWAANLGVFLAEGNPNTIPHLTGEKLRRYRFPKPPLAEQRAIVNYLDRETSMIDRMVAKVEEAIERLQEYRTALITAAVTGKIDVRNVRHSGENRNPGEAEGDGHRLSPV